MPDMSSPRKPPRRFWLFAPYGAVLVVALVWSMVWLDLSQQIVHGLDATAARLRERGWTVEWSERTVGGYPFRLDVNLEAPRIAEPSGWSVAAPRLKGEAYAYAPGHWVLAAPQGLTLTRPGRGAVSIAGQALRASVIAAGGDQAPRIAVEGLKLAFTAGAGATPLPIATCDHLGLYLRSLPGDAAEFQLHLEGAVPTRGGLLARLDPSQPVSLIWDQSLTRVSALRGANWPSAVRAWSAAGGVLTLAHGQLSATDLIITVKSDQMSIDPDGRPEGALSLDLSQAGAAPARLGPAVALATLFKTSLRLKDGSLLLGPFRIAAAPRVY